MIRTCSRLFSARFYNSYTKKGSDIDKKLVLYGDEASPPVRFVLMTASALGIKLKFHEIDLFAGENKTEFYKKVNPLQKVPALEIKDGFICDSHAISMYLCQISADKSLYPSTASAKAKIDEMLFFNSGTLFPLDSAIFTDYFAGKPLDAEKLDKLYLALDHLEFRLNKNIWLTGSEVTLSDICLMATVTSIYMIVNNKKEHKKINAWLRRCETLPFYEINKRGLNRLNKFVSMLKH